MKSFNLYILWQPIRVLVDFVTSKKIYEDKALALTRKIAKCLLTFILLGNES